MIQGMVDMKGHVSRALWMLSAVERRNDKCEEADSRLNQTRDLSDRGGQRGICRQRRSFLGARGIHAMATASCLSPKDLVLGHGLFIGNILGKSFTFGTDSYSLSTVVSHLWSLKKQSTPCSRIPRRAPPRLLRVL